MIEDTGEPEREQAEREGATSGDRRDRGLGGFAAGVLLGAVLGIGQGLLFAPQRGEVSRKRLRKRLAKLRERAEDGLERAGMRTGRELERRRKRMEEALERLRER